jgi:propanediol dehydratase small subunit
MPTENSHQVGKIAPQQAEFLMTPEQHRRRAQNMRDAGRPDLAKQHENLAKAIEYRGQQGRKRGRQLRRPAGRTFEAT